MAEGNVLKFIAILKKYPWIVSHIQTFQNKLIDFDMKSTDKNQSFPYMYTYSTRTASACSIRRWLADDDFSHLTCFNILIAIRFMAFDSAWAWVGILRMWANRSLNRLIICCENRKDIFFHYLQFTFWDHRTQIPRDVPYLHV